MQLSLQDVSHVQLCHAYIIVIISVVRQDFNICKIKLID